jgi:hypothetical protein
LIPIKERQNIATSIEDGSNGVCRDAQKKEGRSLVQLIICALVKDSVAILFSLATPRFILEKGKIYNGRTGDLFGQSFLIEKSYVLKLVQH